MISQPTAGNQRVVRFLLLFRYFCWTCLGANIRPGADEILVRRDLPSKTGKRRNCSGEYCAPVRRRVRTAAMITRRSNFSGVRSRVEPLAVIARRRNCSVPDFAKNTFPPYWGPRVWKALHTIAANYEMTPSDTLKQHAAEFLLSLPFLLPCGYCGWHFHRQLEDGNISEIVSSKSNFISFLVHAHNTVTEHVNSKAVDGVMMPTKRTWTVDEAQSAYERSTCVASLDAVWDALHLIAAGYHVPDGEIWVHAGPPELYRHRTKLFISALPWMLPCQASDLHQIVENAQLDGIVSDKINLNAFFVAVHKHFNSSTRISSVDEAKEEYFDAWATACVSETREWTEVNIYGDVINVSTCPAYTNLLSCSTGTVACVDQVGPQCQ